MDEALRTLEHNFEEQEIMIEGLSPPFQQDSEDGEELHTWNEDWSYQGDDEESYEARDERSEPYQSQGEENCSHESQDNDSDSYESQHRGNKPYEGSIATELLGRLHADNNSNSSDSESSSSNKCSNSPKGGSNKGANAPNDSASDDGSKFSKRSGCNTGVFADFSSSDNRKSSLSNSKINDIKMSGVCNSFQLDDLLQSNLSNSSSSKSISSVEGWLTSVEFVTLHRDVMSEIRGSHSPYDDIPLNTGKASHKRLILDYDSEAYLDPEIKSDISQYFPEQRISEHQTEDFVGVEREGLSYPPSAKEILSSYPEPSQEQPIRSRFHHYLQRHEVLEYLNAQNTRGLWGYNVFIPTPIEVQLYFSRQRRDLEKYPSIPPVPDPPLASEQDRVTADEAEWIEKSEIVNELELIRKGKVDDEYVFIKIEEEEEEEEEGDGEMAVESEGEEDRVIVAVP